MRTLCAVALILSVMAASGAAAEEKPTSLSDARAAVDANMRTPKGKAYDERLGNEFQNKHLSTMKQCKQTAGNDLGSFWILMKLDKDGAVKEVLLYPSTRLGVCLRETLLKDRFSAPPRPAYWVSIYMKLAR